MIADPNIINEFGSNVFLIIILIYAIVWLTKRHERNHEQILEVVKNNTVALTKFESYITRNFKENDKKI